MLSSEETLPPGVEELGVVFKSRGWGTAPGRTDSWPIRVLWFGIEEKEREANLRVIKRCQRNAGLGPINPPCQDTQSRNC